MQYDLELPEYRTTGGVHGSNSKNERITSPTLMWIKALDILLDKIRISGIDFSQVVAISGAGQVSFDLAPGVMSFYSKILCKSFADDVSFFCSNMEVCTGELERIRYCKV